MNIYKYIIYMCANYSKYVRNNKGLYIYTIYIYIYIYLVTIIMKGKSDT